MTLALVQKWIEPLLVEQKRKALTPQKIVQATAEAFEIRAADILGRSQNQECSAPRQIAMYVCKQITRLSLPQIGKDFGGKHHTTVLYSIRKIESLKKKNSEIATAVNKIIQSLR